MIAALIMIMILQDGAVAAAEIAVLRVVMRKVTLVGESRVVAVVVVITVGIVIHRSVVDGERRWRWTHDAPATADKIRRRWRRRNAVFAVAVINVGRYWTRRRDTASVQRLSAVIVMMHAVRPFVGALVGIALIGIHAVVGSLILLLRHEIKRVVERMTLQGRIQVLLVLIVVVVGLATGVGIVGVVDIIVNRIFLLIFRPRSDSDGGPDHTGRPVADRTWRYVGASLHR